MTQTTLTNIISGTREWVDNRKQQITEAHLYEQLSIQEPEDRFFSLLDQAHQNQKTVMIGEVKHRSPSMGVLADPALPATSLVQIYQDAGIDAISYVSNGPFFGGSIEELQALLPSVAVPLLQKDFVLETYQILEAAVMRVDAILLIARILDIHQLQGFIELALLHGVEPVVEVFDQADLDKIQDTSVRVIGVNARNLDDFSVDTSHAEQVITKAAEQALVIGFSGVTSSEKIKRYRDAGATGVLIGTHLMKADDPAAVITQFTESVS